VPRQVQPDERDWLVYLLVDPSTGRPNHPRGEAFYVGMCPWQLHGEQLADLDLSGLADPGSADLAEEPAVRKLGVACHRPGRGEGRVGPLAGQANRVGC
jgi:hypothetical protein